MFPLILILLLFYLKDNDLRLLKIVIVTARFHCMMQKLSRETVRRQPLYRRISNSNLPSQF
jgi:hypothetical protein